MGSTLKLPCVRFLKQVSNGCNMSKYGYLGMMEQNANALETAPWRKAACDPKSVALTVNKVIETDGALETETGIWTKQPTYTAYFKDNYDCFKQGGDAVSKNATFCGYLGMVAYRFTLPTENPGAIDEMKLMIQRDRYLRSGVRIAVEFNDSAKPSDDWAVIRGEAENAIVTDSTPSSSPGVKSWGFLNQCEVPYLTASRSAGESWTVSRDDFAGLNKAATAKYVWVYLSCEDLTGYWEWYNETDQRYYAIEGSAALFAACSTFAFATDAVAPDYEDEQADDVVWGRDTFAHPTSIPGADWDYSGESGDAERLARFGSFALCSGISGFLAPIWREEAAGSIWQLMSRSKGELLFDSFRRAEGKLTRAIGYHKEYCELPHLAVLAGVPKFSRGDGLFFLLRRVDTDNDNVNGVRCQVAAQMFLGASLCVVPSDKTEFTRIRLIDAEFNPASAVGCKISVNVWKSESLSFFGGFPEVALQALMADPALFTGRTKTVNGSASEAIWPDVSQGTDGKYACAGSPMQVSVSVTAELIATVSLDSAREIRYGDADSYAIDITGLSVKPGDVIILAPRVDYVKLEGSALAAHWGVGTSGPRSLDLSKESCGICPIFKFG